MIEKGFPKFFTSLKLSVLDSAKQYFVLLKTVLAILLMVIRGALIPAAVFVLLAVKAESRGIVLVIQIIIFLWFLFLVVRFDGALGYALTKIAAGERRALFLGMVAYQKGFSFFANALKTGVFLFFGQMLLVCPCFLLMTNFVLSPYLYVFEGVRGREARERSRELAAVNPWMVFAQTAYLILIGYVLLIFAAVVFIETLGSWTLALFIPLALFLGSVQSNYIYRLYWNLLEAKSSQSEKPKVDASFKIFVGVSVAVVLAVYLGFRFLPALVSK